MAALEAELAKAKAEVESWKEAHAALARSIQPMPIYVPYQPFVAPPVYVPPYQGPALPWFDITCNAGVQS